MIYDAVIVGGGASGLTAAAYLAKFGRRVLLCEKEAVCGGLVNSFERNGFIFDSGIRALEDAGVLFTMLRQLGLEMEFVKNRVSLGIEDQVIEITSDQSLDEYGELLCGLYPESKNEIDAIINDLRQITHYMDIQYGIDNPLFLDPIKDREYFIKKVFPWMFKYALTVRKVMAKNRPVIPYLRVSPQTSLCWTSSRSTSSLKHPPISPSVISRSSRSITTPSPVPVPLPVRCSNSLKTAV